MNTKKFVILALIISGALIIHYFESFIPVPAPGVKLGLSNVMILITIALYGPLEALIVLVNRALLGALLAGSPWSVVYSMSGGLLSLLVMSFLYLRFGRQLSLTGISTLGAAFHNIGQLTAASLIFGTFGIFYTYLPLLMLVSMITGTFTGIAAHFSTKGLLHVLGNSTGSIR